MLTEIEREILWLKCQKDSDETIAAKLGTSKRSVTRYAAGACKKLGKEKLAGAIATAIQLDLIPAPEESLIDIFLNEQEKKVGRLLTQGLTNPKIATEIDKPLSTVRKTIETLLKKMGCSNRRELAANLASAEYLS